jgi:hypothetical protein
MTTVGKTAYETALPQESAADMTLFLDPPITWTQHHCSTSQEPYVWLVKSYQQISHYTAIPVTEQSNSHDRSSGRRHAHTFVTLHTYHTYIPQVHVLPSISLRWSIVAPYTLIQTYRLQEPK